jgi:hypothetical protein
MRLIFKVERTMPLSFDEEVVILEGRYGYVRLILPLDHGLQVGQEMDLSNLQSVGNIDSLKDPEYSAPMAFEFGARRYTVLDED